MKRKLWLLSTLIIIIFLFIGISFFIFDLKVKKEKNNFNESLAVEEKIEKNRNININFNDNSDVIVTNYSGFRISPNTKIVFDTFYKKCNHNDVKEEVVPNELVNLNEEEIKEKFKGYEIKLLSAEKVILYKEVNSYCGNHFVLREKDGVISIFKLNDSGNEELLDFTDILVQYLPETDKLNLQNGIKIYGEETLDKTLEDFE